MLCLPGFPSKPIATDAERIAWHKLNLVASKCKSRDRSRRPSASQVVREWNLVVMPSSPVSQKPAQPEAELCDKILPMTGHTATMSTTRTDPMTSGSLEWHAYPTTTDTTMAFPQSVWDDRRTTSNSTNSAVQICGELTPGNSPQLNDAVEAQDLNMKKIEARELLKRMKDIKEPSARAQRCEKKGK